MVVHARQCKASQSFFVVLFFSSFQFAHSSACAWSLDLPALSRWCWPFTPSWYCQGWRCFVGCIFKTTGKRRSGCATWPGGRSRRHLQPRAGTTDGLLVGIRVDGRGLPKRPFFWEVAHPSCVQWSGTLAQCRTSGSRSYRWGPSFTHLGESGRIDRRSVHGRSRVVA